MLKDYLKFDNLNRDFNAVYDCVRQGVPSAIFNLPETAKCHIAGNLFGKVLYIVSDNLSADEKANLLRELTDKKVAVLYAKDEVLLYTNAFYKRSLYKRLTGLYDIIKGAEIIVAPIESLLQLFPSKLPFITFSVDREFNLEAAVSSLVKIGYKREDAASIKGTFSLRGDILEIFPINLDNPIRIDFFGDEVESVKSFDAESRDIIDKLKTVDIVPATDVFIEDNEFADLITELKKEGKALDKAEYEVKLNAIKDEIIAALESRTVTDGMHVLLPLLTNVTGDITEFIGGDLTVVFDECKKIGDTLKMAYKEHTERALSLAKQGAAFSFSIYQLGDINEILHKLLKCRLLAVQQLTTAINFFSPLKTFTFNAGTVPKYKMKFNELITDIKNWQMGGYNVVIATETKKRAEELGTELINANIRYGINVKADNLKAVTLLSEKLSKGIIYHSDKLVIIGSGDIYSKSVSEKPKIKKKKNEFFSAPEIGDIAVHEVHGIGIVRGTKCITTTEGTKDYIALEYAGGDLLYIPVEQTDELSRYLGGDEKPKLSRLGGKDFEKVKQRAREAIKLMSFDLKALYEKRSKEKGFKFSEDGDMQELFEESFPFEETPDQLIAANEIMEDMCSDKVMDRLLCGDVGFGKTEVAFRAAFRAVLNDKQVAFLAPTTILTNQHYNTAIERFKDFGVNISVLNRFKKPAEQDKILKDLAEGKIDIIIGTHRLLGPDVKFKDLGLLVLDEEQRFGVEHKEKIKLLKNNVDTLTLSATPIPRTLHMSLSGIRDISTLNTPPKERIPVQTYVTEETDALITDAVTREIARGGQVFILYNRVETIQNFSAKLKDLMSEVKFITVHGQMDEAKLEKGIMDFYEGKADVLIATTIIENGIDLPKANTLIVIDADRLGLSTLYQLKGRVGRSNRMAHAYFTFKKDKVLSDASYKRLNAIMEFAEMGSGFKIAMRDLEIRGAGNVLGREQHGHMDKIGYELYSKLLKEELGEPIKTATELDVRVTAFIPKDYIESDAGRMDAYKEIAEIANPQEEKRVRLALTDFYGEIPFEVDNLIAVAMVKNYAQSLGAKEVDVRRAGAEIIFSDINAFTNVKLTDATKNNPDVTISFAKEPKLLFKTENRTNEDVLFIMREFLEKCV